MERDSADGHGETRDSTAARSAAREGDASGEAEEVLSSVCVLFIIFNLRSIRPSITIRTLARAGLRC